MLEKWVGSSDSFLQTKEVAKILKFKWLKGASVFYKAQFFNYLLFSLSFFISCNFEAILSSKVLLFFNYLTILTIAQIILRELLQFLSYPKKYFTIFGNLIDLAIVGVCLWQTLELMKGVKPNLLLLTVTFMFVQLKLLKYLAAFDSTRFYIRMIQEVIKEIQPFLVILFFVLFCYAQIIINLRNKETLTWQKNNQTYIEAYFFALGDYANFDKKPNLQFVVFLIFSLLISIAMMNFLVGIMSDVYTRINENSVAADSRTLAGILVKYELVVRFLRKTIGKKNKENY